MRTQRVELKFGLLLSALGSILGRFIFFTSPISDFLSGAFIAVGILLLVITLLPENVYNNLLYRKWIANKNG